MIDEKWRKKEPWENYWLRPYIHYRKHHELFWGIIKDESSGKILDMGCGPACIWENTNKDVTGVDFSENAIKEAKTNVPSGNFIVSDVTNIPLSESFDTIVLCGVVNFFPDLAYLRKEVKRLSTQGTKVIITINDLHGLNGRYWDIGEIMKEFGQWGNLKESTFYERIGWLIVVVV